MPLPPFDPASQDADPTLPAGLQWRPQHWDGDCRLPLHRHGLLWLPEVWSQREGGELSQPLLPDSDPQPAGRRGPGRVRQAEHHGGPGPHLPPAGARHTVDQIEVFFDFFSS